MRYVHAVDNYATRGYLDNYKASSGESLPLNLNVVVVL